MPADDEEIEGVLEEGVEICNGLGPEKVLVTSGRAAGVRFVRCLTVYDQSGRFNPSFDSREKREIEADWVILSIGQAADFNWLKEVDRFEFNEDGTLKVDPDGRTTVPGFFAGGDATSLPGSVAAALAAGKRAAVSIHLSLNPEIDNKDLEPALLAGGPGLSIQSLFEPRVDWDPRTVVRFSDLEPLFLDRHPAGPVKRLEVEERRGFSEINLGLDPGEAQSAAGRCLFCGTCVGCDRCYYLCPDLSVLRPVGQEGSYRLDLDYCKGCGVCAAACLGRVIDMGGEA
jgi:hypothetical protein